MIDGSIPDLTFPPLRRLYMVLLGREDPTRNEKVVLLGVAADIIQAAGLRDFGMRITEGDSAYIINEVALIIDRAFKIDPKGAEDRMRAFAEEFQREADAQREDD